ncbi:MAG: metal ABC transporter permease [Solirubrobacteraceae bacterium]
MFSHEFVRNAYLSGTFIALACGVVGWFVVLRAQVFAADALSHVAFVGTIGAALSGVNQQLGLVVATLAVAGVMTGLGRRAQADDVVIGIVFAWILGIGILLITLLATSARGGQGTITIGALSGSIFGLSAGAAWIAAGVGILVTAAVGTAFRPLLFSTLDPELAVVRGVPVRALGIAFLGALALVTAESTQAVGALLLLGLLAAPAGAAHHLTDRPRLGIAVSGLIAVAAMWAGLALSYAIASLPPSSAIIGLAAAAYGAAALGVRLCDAEGRRRIRRTTGG